MLRQDRMSFSWPVCIADVIFKTSSAVAEMVDCGHNRHAPIRGVGCCAPFAGGAGSPSNTMLPGPRSVGTKWCRYPSSCLATVDVLKTVGL